MELVILNNEKEMVTTSRIIAKSFNKEHKNVVRDIRNLECSKEFNRLNFEPITYKDSRGREKPEYMIKKDGFIFLVTGYTGAKAAGIKEAYIKAFNKMEDMVRGYKNDPLSLIKNSKKSDLFKLAYEQQLQLEQQEEKLIEMTPKAEFHDAVSKSKYLMDLNEVAKLLSIKNLGRNNLYQFLREKHIIRPCSTEPYQEYVKRGYFKLVQTPYNKGKETKVHIKTVATQKGLIYLFELFKRNGINIPESKQITLLEMVQ